MHPFLFQSPTKIQFGVGASRKLPAVLQALKIQKPMLVSGAHVSKTKGFAALLESLHDAGYAPALYLSMVADPPAALVDEAAAQLRASGCDGVIAVGGGSPIDAAKAMSMLARNTGGVQEYLFGGSRTVENAPLPLICVPTTAGSGSEVSAASVITDTENHIKLSITHESLFAKYAVIDPALHLDMPPHITATTGMDALTHALESFVSKNATPISDAYGAAAMQRIAQSLPVAYDAPQNLEARSQMAIASTMAATAMVNGGLGAVHGIAQALGGIAHVPHGAANATMLPHVMEKNIAGNPKKFRQIAEFLGENIAGLSDTEGAARSTSAVRHLVQRLGIPARLRDAGVTRVMFPAIIEGTMAYRLLPLNPVALTAEDVAQILENAY